MLLSETDEILVSESSCMDPKSLVGGGGGGGGGSIFFIEILYDCVFRRREVRTPYTPSGSSHDRFHDIKPHMMENT